MNKQKILSLLIVLGLTSCCLMFSGFTFFKKKVEKAQPVVQTTQNYSNVQNNLWCVTFQLVWNEFVDKFMDGKPVQFVGGNPQIADELNKQLYTSEILSEDSYYTTYGEISKKLKKDIEKTIYKKFNEKSDILDKIDWSVKDAYLFYSMLKKNFTFNKPFDKLSSTPFNSSEDLVKYFGIKDSSNKKLRENVSVLFYNSIDDCAVMLKTKENEDVILYRTDKQDTFENYFEYIQANAKDDEFGKKDILLVPEINVNKTISYDDLCGKEVEGTGYMISQALQTIQFKLDNKGGSLKSEAAMSAVKTALRPEVVQKRYFMFNKPFVLFLMENGKEKPYYAMKVDNTDFLVKE